MPLSAAEAVIFRVRCPQCGQHTEKVLSWLLAKGEMICPNPICASTISLKVGENGQRIKKLADACAELNAAASP